MSSEQSRKVLEDIQRAKSKLLKDGAAASLGIGYASSASQPSLASASHFTPGVGAPAFNSDVHMSPAQRSAMQILQHAHVTSFGFFVAQDSHFGNSILPVLPRIDTPPEAPGTAAGGTLVAATLPTVPISTAAAVKVEK